MTFGAVGTPSAPLEPPHTFGRLLGESALYAVGSLVGKVVGVLLLPFVARSLEPAQFGRLDVLSTLASSASAIGLLGVDFAATRIYPDLPAEPRRRLAGSWLALALLTMLPVAAATFVWRRSLSTLLFDTPALGTSVGLLGVVVASTVLQLVGLTLLRSQRRPTPYAWITGGTLAVYGTLVVAFVTQASTVESVMWAYALSQATGATVALLISLRGRAGRPSRVMTRRLLGLGLPALPAMAALVVGDVLHRTILLGEAGDQQVGYLSVAVRFGSIVLLAVVGFQLAWQPATFAATGTALRDRLREGEHMLSLLALVALGTAAVAPEAVELVAGAAYRGATPAVGYMLAAGLLYGAFQVVTMPSALARRPGDISIAAVVGGGVAVVTNLLVASRHGATGTAAAIAIGQAVAVVVGGGLATRHAEGDAPRAGAVARCLVPIATMLAVTVPGSGTPVVLRTVLVFGAVLALVAGDPRLVSDARALTRRRPRGPTAPR